MRQQINKSLVLCTYCLALITFVHASPSSNNNNNNNPSFSSLFNTHNNEEKSKLKEDVITTASAYFTTDEEKEYCNIRNNNDTMSLSSVDDDESSSLVMAEYYKFLDDDDDKFDEIIYDDESDEEEDDDDDDTGGDSMILSNTFISNRLLSSSSNVNVAFATTQSHAARDKNCDDMEGEEQKRRIKCDYASRKLSFFNNDAIRGGGPSSENMKKLFVAALVTLMYEASIGHLLEFMKIVFQTSPPGTTYSDVFKTITSEKGIAGIWDGFVPWGIIQSIGKGASFGFANSYALQLLGPHLASSNPKILSTLAGGIGGGFQGYVLSPTLLLKTRVMTNPVFREQMSFLKTSILSLKIGFDVVLQEGFLALMKGSNVFALKRVFDWSTRYYFSDLFISLLLKLFHSDQLSVTQNAIADFLGGTVSTLSTLPLDVLVAKIQDAKKAGVALSPMQMIADDLKNYGWNGFINNYTKGFIARLLHVCFTTIAMKTGTKIMYDALYGTN